MKAVAARLPRAAAALNAQTSSLRRILPDMVTIISARGGYRSDATIGSIDIDDAVKGA